MFKVVVFKQLCSKYSLDLLDYVIYRLVYYIYILFDYVMVVGCACVVCMCVFV